MIEQPDFKDVKIQGGGYSPELQAVKISPDREWRIAKYIFDGKPEYTLVNDASNIRLVLYSPTWRDMMKKYKAALKSRIAYLQAQMEQLSDVEEEE